MAEQVLLAVPSWTPDKDDGGIYVALPFACSDCTIRSTELPFSDCDPFQRGLLMFLLAGIKRPGELADLLGIRDVAFVDLMINELERRGLVRRSDPGEVALTLKAKDIYRSAPGTISQQTYGRVLYFHDGTRGYVVAGPLDQDSRIEIIEDLANGVGRISVGTEGKPLYMECITPRMPNDRPNPMQSDDAQRGLRDFVAKTLGRSSVARGAPRENFTVSLREPRWERLLVRVVPVSGSHPRAKNRRGRQPDLSVLIGEAMLSPHALSQFQHLQRSDDQLKVAVSRRVVRPKPTADAADESGGGAPTKSKVSPDVIDDEVTESPTVIDTSLTAELTRALCARAAAVSSSMHVPLVEDRPTTDATVRSRIELVGFATTDCKGDEIPFPHIPDEVIGRVRRGEWASVDHLWTGFCAWTLMDDIDLVRPAATLVPDLPSIITEAHWGRHSGHRDELHHLLDHLSSLREEPA